MVMAIERGNVQKLHVGSIEGKIKTFLREIDRQSENTSQNYYEHIVQFFRYMTGKELNQLYHNDSNDTNILFTNDQLIDYKNDLIEGIVTGKKLCGSTVNVKMSAIRSLYEFLAITIKDIDMSQFKMKKEKHVTKSSGYLSFDNAIKMIEMAGEESDGAEKSLMLELASFTSIRLNSLWNFNINGRNEKVHRSSWIEREGDVWVVCAVDKGQKPDRKPIRDELYNKIKSMVKPDGSLWTLSERTFQRVVEKLSDNLGLKNDHVTFHSLKNVAVNWILETTGDVIEATKQANHTDMNTMWRYYANKSRNYNTMAGRVMGQKQDLSPLQQLSQEQMFALIQKASPAVQAELLKLVNGGM